MRWKLFAKKPKSFSPRISLRGKCPYPLLVEVLEQRAAPVALVAGPNTLEAGEIGTVGPFTVIAVNAGKAVVWMSAADGGLDVSALTGVSLTDGSAITLFSDVNGDVVTNLNNDGTLSGPLHDGSVLLDADILAITFADSATILSADGLTTTTTVVNSFGSASIFGNILAGRSIQNIGTIASWDGTKGATSFATNTTPVGPASHVEIVATGTAAGGRLVNFAGQDVTTILSEADALPGQIRLIPVVPLKNSPYDISNVQVAEATALLTGDGAADLSDLGKEGGDLINIAITLDPDGFFIRTGQGGAGWSGGGRGGDIINSNFNGGASVVMPIVTGEGGDGLAINPKSYGGRGGNIQGVTVTGTGAYPLSVGNGGDGTQRGGDGGSVLEFTPTGSTTAVGLTGTINFQVQATPRDVVAADFNGDTIVDILTANFGTSNVSVQLGIGNGRFAGGIEYSAGTRLATAYGTNQITAGDFNGDFILDFATTNGLSQTVSVFLGNGEVTGDGTFRWVAEYPMGHNPTGLVTADFNTDTILDLAVINQDDGTISMIFGNGDGTFITRTSADEPWEFDIVCDPINLNSARGFGGSTLTSPRSIATGDFNEDGRPDLVIALDRNENPVPGGTDTNPSPAYVGVYLNRADRPGLFNLPEIVTVLQTDIPENKHAQAVAVADIDLDGHLDIVAATELFDDPAHGINENEVHNTDVIFGDGSGIFSDTIGFPLLDIHVVVGDDPRDITVADMTGDGVPDIVTANAGGTISILRQRTNGPDPLGSCLPPTCLEEEGGFDDPITIASDSGPAAIIAGDFNSDGRPDLMTAASGAGSATLHLGIADLSDSDGIFDDFTNVPTDTPTTAGVAGDDQPRDVAFGDFDRDGVTDMVVANSASQSLMVYLGNGDGNFYNAPVLLNFLYTFPANAVITGVDVGNINADIDPNLDDTEVMDIAVSWYDGITDDGFVSVFFGSIPNPGEFGVRNDILVNGLRPMDVEIADMGGFTATNTSAIPDQEADDVLDIITANFSSDNVSVMYQNIDAQGGALGTFRAGINYSTGAGTQPVALDVGDLFGAAPPDGGPDGVMDIVTANFGPNSVSVLQGIVLQPPPNIQGIATLNYVLVSTVGSGGVDPIGIQIADCLGNDEVGFVVANYASDNVVCFFGNNFGGFFAAATGSLDNASTGPTDLVVTDITNDGVPDIVTVNEVSNDINVFVGRRVINQNPPPTFANYIINDPFVFSLPNNTEIPTPGSNPPPPLSLSIATGLINLDDVPDLAITDFTSDQVTIFVGIAFTVSSPIGFDAVRSPGNSLDLIAGTGGNGLNAGSGGGLTNITLNVSGAGFQDNARPTDIVFSAQFGTTLEREFATANAGSDSVNVGGADYPVAPEPRTLVAGDFNGDGFDDVATVSFTENKMYLLLSSGQFESVNGIDQGTMWLEERDGEVISFDTGGVGALDMSTGDVNGDGLLDVIIANVFSDSVSILFGQETTEFDINTGLGIATFDINPVVLPLPPGARPQAVLATDFNNDDLADIITANYGSDNITVFLALGGGAFATPDNYDVGRGPSGLALFHVNPLDNFFNPNGDNFPDLVVTNFADNNVSILTNDGTGVFTLFPVPANLSTTELLVQNPVGVAVDQAFTSAQGILGVVSQTGDVLSFPISLNNGVFKIFPTDQILDNLDVGATPFAVSQFGVTGLFQGFPTFDYFTADYTDNTATDVRNGPGNVYASVRGTTDVQATILDEVTVVTGSGGSSALGRAGHGATVTTLSGNVGRDSDFVLRLGDGGDGALSGGNGGALIGTLTQPPAGSPAGTLPTTSINISVTSERFIQIRTGNGGDALTGNAGFGGNIANASFTSSGDNFIFLDSVFLRTGDGGDSLSLNGGKAGDVLNVNVTLSLPSGRADSAQIILGSGGDGARAGGVGGSLLNSNFVDTNVLTDAAVFAIAGNGGNGISSRGGDGGRISNLSLTDFYGAPKVTTSSGATQQLTSAGMAFQTGTGGQGKTGGRGGSVDRITLITTTNLHIDNILVLTGDGGLGTGGRGGDAGSIRNITGDAQSLVQMYTGTGGDSVNSSGGRGGDISQVTMTTVVEKGIYIAGPGGDGFTRGGFGGNISSSHTNASLAMMLQSGDGGAAGGPSGKGGLGGNISSFNQTNASFLALSQMVAGAGGFGASAGGTGGSIIGVNTFGSIGDLRASTYGIKSITEILSSGASSHVHIGGIFAGLGGGAGAGGRVGNPGSVSDITARAITSIVGGMGFSPVAATSISGIIVTALGFVFNPAQGFKSPSPLGYDTNGDTAFAFIDANNNNLYDAGETPLDGLVMANKLASITVQKQKNNAETIMTTPLFMFNPLTGQRIGTQDPQ